MAHTIYDNFVLENRIEDLLTTAVDLNNYMTIDTSLATEPGMKKKINVYTSTGNVEELAMGEGNSQEIEVTFTTKEYEVGTTQGKFTYYDEQEMSDPLVVDTGLKGMAERMINDLTAKAIAELGKGTKIVYGATGTFANVVDAISEMNLEDESGLFMLINPAEKAAFRKNLGEELKYAEDFARTGYIGSVCGVPVIVSKAVPAGVSFLATKAAVTCFIKKGSEIEQERDADHRKNSVFARKVMLVALTDDTKVIRLAAKTDPRANYTLLESEPASWSTNFTNYYVYDSEKMTVTKLTGSEAPKFEANKYYQSK